MKIDRNSWKNILIYNIGYGKLKYLSYTTIKIVNISYHINNKVNDCMKESSGNKYLTLVATD